MIYIIFFQKYRGVFKCIVWERRLMGHRVFSCARCGKTKYQALIKALTSTVNKEKYIPALVKRRGMISDKAPLIDKTTMFLNAFDGIDKADE